MTARAIPETLGEVIADLARARPDAPALRDGAGRTVGFGAFHARTRRLCGAVAAQGLKKGARVAVLSRNRIEFAETFGLAQLGLVIVPLNWRLGPGAIVDLIRDCAPEAIFVDAGHLALIAAHRGELPFVRLVVCYDGPGGGVAGYEALLTGAASDPVLPDVTGDDALSLIYTSGTTGRPKGAVVTHRGALANMRMSRDSLLELGQGDRVLAAMPFFHVGGLWYHFFAAFASGCETTILPEFDPGAVLAAMARDRISVVHLVPTMVGALIEHADFAASDLGALRRIFYAGSPMPGALLRRAMGAMETCEFLQAYGSTEAGIVSALTPEDHRRALRGDRAEMLRSCGRAIDGVDLRIAQDGRDMPADGIGEIEVRSDGAIGQYWENPAATAALRADAWVRTGDLGYIDPEGYLFLVDRKNDLIVTGGENVYPTEVEAHLLRLDGIAEAAVFGTPHPKWIEQVTAVVVPRAGRQLDPSAILAELRKGLAHYKCPKRVILADHLPRNGLGKVVRAHLRNLHASREGEA